MMNQSATVVERRDPSSLGQAGLQVCDLLLYGVDDFESIGAGTNHDHSADRFFPIPIKHAAPEIWAEVYVGDIAQVDGSAITCGEHNIVDIGDGLDQADAAHCHLGIVDLHDLGAHVGVA